MKNFSTFAATNTSQSGKIRLMFAAGFFCACTLLNIYGFVPPCGVVNAPTALRVLVSGKGGTVFISAKTNKFLADMTNRENNCLNGQNMSSNRLTNEQGIQSFSFEGAHNVRVIEIEGKPWFVAQDVCIVLSLCNTSKTVSNLDDDEKGVTLSYTHGGSQQHLIVNESGLYALILRCRDAMKKGTVPYKFRKWVTSEVLPSIRKTGSYSVNASYPGEMIPTNCAVITCYTADGQSKQAYLLWGDDTWFQCGKWNGEREIVMKSHLGQVGSYDKDTVQYNTHAYLLKDGKWESSCFLSPTVDKRPKNENAVTNCQKAIERYRKAAEDVKASAGAMIEYLNEKL